jgi:hypothetical protein
VNRLLGCAALLVVAVSAALIGGVAPASPAFAQEPNQAGLLVVQGNGAVLSSCVSFSEESVSGYDLLVAAGHDLTSEQAAMGATICSIEGEGCAYPQESCFCRCQGSECIYWSYWRLTEAGWQYANLGAANQRVMPGDVQAWVWGPGTSGAAPEPPPTSFASLCQAPASAEVEAAALPSTAQAGDASQAEDGSLSALSASAPAVDTALPDGAAVVSQSGRPAVGIQMVPGSWVWLAGAALIPLLIILGLRRRNGRPSDDPAAAQEDDRGI